MPPDVAVEPIFLINFAYCSTGLGNTAAETESVEHRRVPECRKLSALPFYTRTSKGCTNLDNVFGVGVIA